MHVHKLTGCNPVPLAHYLKALGILRLVARQADPEARGCFRDDTFVLCTGLDADALVQFFLERYQPTPLIAPWNGGSGFYPKDNRVAIQAIRDSKSDRFAGYREAIALATELVGGRAEAPKDEPKFALQRALQQRASGVLAEWLDAVFVIGSDGSPKYPALLGTGGNDGRLDFTNNFMQRIAELFDLASDNGAPVHNARALLTAALWDVPIAGLSDFAIGQFLPGAVGGANSGPGFRGTPAINPWDFVLMLEGATVLRPSATKQLESQDLVQAGAPFAFRAAALGYASSAESEEEGARGEQWMPLWSQPATFDEVSTMFAEGRSQVGRSPAQRPLDFARAVARFGVSRGVESFQRYGFIERNGQANLAVPLARWKVRIGARQDLVDHAAQWVDRLRMMTRADTAPSRLKRAVRRCEEALLAVCEDGADKIRWQRALMELGSAERALLKSPKFTAEKNLRPLPTLFEDWLDVADDGSPEWRIAAAVASLHDVDDAVPPKEDTSGKAKVAINWDASIRRYALPLDERSAHAFRTFDIGQSGLVLPPHVVMRGDNVVDDLVALAFRRVTEAVPGARGTFGLTNAKRVCASLTDVAMFIDGRLDDRRIVQLFWPLLAVSWRKVTYQARRTTRSDVATVRTLTAFALFRSAAWLTPPASEGEEYPRLEPSILRALQGGDVTRAAREAIRRLRATGIVPKMSVVTAAPAAAPRILAGLLIPLPADAESLLREHIRKPEVHAVEQMNEGEANG